MHENVYFFSLKVLMQLECSLFYDPSMLRRWETIHIYVTQTELLLGTFYLETVSTQFTTSLLGPDTV